MDRADPESARILRAVPLPRNRLKISKRQSTLEACAPRCVVQTGLAAPTDGDEFGQHALPADTPAGRLVSMPVSESKAQTHPELSFAERAGNFRKAVQIAN